MAKKKKKKRKVSNHSIYRDNYHEPMKNKSKLGNIVLTMALMPLVIASAIAVMALSYMFVPLAIVLILGSAVYFTIRFNRS